MTKHILKYLSSLLLTALSVLWTILVLNFGDSLYSIELSTELKKVLLLLIGVSILVNIYLSVKILPYIYKNPRRFLIYQENGHFWYSWFSKNKYCGHCMNEGERRELKYNGRNIWECTNFDTPTDKSVGILGLRKQSS